MFLFKKAIHMNKGWNTVVAKLGAKRNELITGLIFCICLHAPVIIFASTRITTNIGTVLKLYIFLEGSSFAESTNTNLTVEFSTMLILFSQHSLCPRLLKIISFFNVGWGATNYCLRHTSVTSGRHAVVVQLIFVTRHQQMQTIAT